MQKFEKSRKRNYSKIYFNLFISRKSEMKLCEILSDVFFIDSLSTSLAFAFTLVFAAVVSLRRASINMEISLMEKCARKSGPEL